MKDKCMPSTGSKISRHIAVCTKRPKGPIKPSAGARISGQTQNYYNEYCKELWKYNFSCLFNFM